jgi:hypothetical protein
MISLRLEQAAFAAAVVTGFTVAFERIDPSLGLTQDLRLTNLRAAALLTLMLWLLACCSKHHWPRLPRGIALPAALWLTSVSASALLAPSYTTQALAFTRDLIFGALFGWAVFDLASTRSRQLLVIRALAIGGLGVALVGLAEAANVRSVVDWLAGFRYQSSFSIGEVPRVSATLPHPNIAAMVLGLALPLSVAWLATARTLWMRLGLAAGVLIELGSLVLTVSRAGILVSEVVLGLMLAGGWRYGQPMLTRSSLAALVALPILFVLSTVAQPLLLLHLSGEGVEGWYRADYSMPNFLTTAAGEATVVPVRLVNSGARTWTASGEHPFALSYHLDQADGTPILFDGPRTRLPHDVGPGSAVELQAELVAPPTPGRYLLEWDVVQESVTWFSWAGSPSGPTDLSVLASVAANSQQQLTPTPAAGMTPPPPPDRLMQWRIALRMARNRPLVGIGPDNFRWVYGDFAGVSQWDTGSHANSLYFEWLADTGVLGLGLFLWFAWRLLRRSMEGLLRPPARVRSDPWWVWRLALAGSLGGWLLHGLADYFYEPLPTNLAFWLVAALALAGMRAESKACA